MRKIVVVFLVLLLLVIPVGAETVVEEQAEQIGTEALKEGLQGDAKDAMEQYDPNIQSDFLQGAKDLLSQAFSSSGSALKTAMHTMLRILVILSLCKLVDAIGQHHTQKAVHTASALGVTACCASDVRSLVGMGQAAMEEIAAFSDLLLPVMASATAASGAPTAATGVYGVAVFFFHLLIKAYKYVLVPLVYAFLALALADAVLEQERLQKLRDLLGWIIKICMKGIVYAFTGFLTITGLLSGTSDAAALKAAKAAMASMVPVVGGIISGAADTVLAGAGFIRSAAGTFGMLAVLAIFLFPFIKMGISYLIFKLTTALGGLIDQRHGKLLDAITGALGYMLAMTGSTALMSLLSCCFFLKAVTP